MACERIQDPSRAHLGTDEDPGSCQESEDAPRASSPSIMEQQGTRWAGHLPISHDFVPENTVRRATSLGCPQELRLDEFSAPRANNPKWPLRRENSPYDLVHLILAPQTHSSVDLHQFDLEILSEARQFPPITTAELNKWSVTNIISQAWRRYDLNFDKEKPITPSHSNEEKAEAVEYWKALMVELAFYMECALKPRSACILHTALFPSRLEKLFITLRENLRTLIRADDWPFADELLNVPLLMQQLDRGICDLGKLSTRIGEILKGSCSPLRDAAVEAAVGIVQRAVERSNPVELAHGLDKLFDLLETMKLDIANHQLRFLRLLMISDSTDYVQEHFRKRMFGAVGQEAAFSSEGLHAARMWYHGVISRAQQEQNSEIDGQSEDETEAIEGSPLMLLGRGIRDLIRPTNFSWLPVTFEYDIGRLQKIRLEYNEILFTYQLSYLFDQALIDRGLRAELYGDARQELLSRISKLSQGKKRIELKDMALEIVRAAYAVCGIQRPPSEADTISMDNKLNSVMTPCSDAYDEVEKKLSEVLGDLLDGEINQIYDLPTLQIANRYEKPYSPPVPYRSLEMEKLQGIAGKLAQITILHWRTWATILYCPRLGSELNSDLASTDSTEPSEESTGRQASLHRSSGRPDEPESDNTYGRSHDEASLNDAGF